MRALLTGPTALLLAVLIGPAQAATPKPQPKPGTVPTGPIYTCVDAQGRRLSSDRPIPECVNQDQRVTNRDGSRSVMPPAQSPEEKARADNARRALETLRIAGEAAARADRLLLSRYPHQAAHDAARVKALEAVNVQIDTAQRRLKELDEDGVELLVETEAMGKKPLTASLRARLASNQGAVAAQRTILKDQESERDRINLQYDAEQARLRALWAGAQPGRLGPLSLPGAADPAASAP